MEKLQLRRLIGVGALAAGTLALSGCSTGQVNAPTIEDIREDGRFFELERPDGTSMVCWEYGSRGNGVYGESPSWFSVTCDWDNSLELAQAPATTQITTTTTSLPGIDQLG